MGIMEKKMETTIMGLYRDYRVYGWLSKLWSLFGYPKYEGPYYNRDPKRDHNFDKQPNDMPYFTMPQRYLKSSRFFFRCQNPNPKCHSIPWQEWCITGLWLVGSEGMEKKMDNTIVCHIGTTI